MGSPPPTLPPLAEPVLIAWGAAVLVSLLVGIALLRWRHTVRWHSTIIAVLVVATAPLFALILNTLWKSSSNVYSHVTTNPIVSGVAMLIVFVTLGIASKLLGGDYQTTRKEVLRAAGGALLILVIFVLSFIVVYCGGFILIALVAWPGMLLQFSIWPAGYEGIDSFVVMISAMLVVWFVFFLDVQRSLRHRRASAAP